MIDFLRGKIAHIEHDYIVLETAGIGYRVFCAQAVEWSRHKEEVVVFIHYHVREDAILLFGFASRTEQELFRKLIEVNGIGPKVAMAMLSGARPEAMAVAIQREDINFLVKLPGVGKKTAQRLILDLKDKLDQSLLYEEVGLDEQPALPRAKRTLSGVWGEVKDGLTALGYTEAEADRALSAVRQEVEGEEPVDQLLKRALKQLYKG